MNTLEPLGFYTPLLIRKGVMRLPFLWLRCLAQSRQTLPQQLMGDWKQVGRVGLVWMALRRCAFLSGPHSLHRLLCSRSRGAARRVRGAAGARPYPRFLGAPPWGHLSRPGEMTEVLCGVNGASAKARREGSSGPWEPAARRREGRPLSAPRPELHFSPGSWKTTMASWLCVMAYLCYGI